MTMPAYTRPDTELIVVFHAGGEAPEERHRACDARDAARIVINLMVERLEFHSGEAILCLPADDPAADMPEVSRSSHYS
jgi:hypothetical protein